MTQRSTALLIIAFSWAALAGVAAFDLADPNLHQRSDLEMQAFDRRATDEAHAAKPSPERAGDEIAQVDQLNANLKRARSTTSSTH